MFYLLKIFAFSRFNIGIKYIIKNKVCCDNIINHCTVIDNLIYTSIKYNNILLMQFCIDELKKCSLERNFNYQVSLIFISLLYDNIEFMKKLLNKKILSPKNIWFYTNDYDKLKNNIISIIVENNLDIYDIIDLNIRRFLISKQHEILHEIRKNKIKNLIK